MHRKEEPVCPIRLSAHSTPAYRPMSTIRFRLNVSMNIFSTQRHHSRLSCYEQTRSCKSTVASVDRVVTAGFVSHATSFILKPYSGLPNDILALSLSSTSCRVTEWRHELTSLSRNTSGRDCWSGVSINSTAIKGSILVGARCVSGSPVSSWSIHGQSTGPRPAHSYTHYNTHIHSIHLALQHTDRLESLKYWWWVYSKNLEWKGDGTKRILSIEKNSRVKENVMTRRRKREREREGRRMGGEEHYRRE